jgi:signal transduction histidine kinase
VQDGESSSSREIRFRSNGREDGIVETEMTVNADEDGAMPDAEAYRLSLTDITETKSVEAELREARAQLERRVNERTMELHTANQTLKKEIKARQEIEAKLRKNQLRLRSLATEVTNTEERERRELARNLHDLVAQTLAIAKMKLSAAEKRAEDQRAVESLQETKNLVQEMIEATRGIMTELSPPVFEEQDVATAVQWLVDHVNEKFDLSVKLADIDPNLELPDDTRRFLYRSLQELLVNVARHAGTGDATVRLARSSDGVVLTVADRGVGFDVGEARTGSGFGIFSIQQRVEDLGGSFSVDSAPGTGTTATLALPALQSD